MADRQSLLIDVHLNAQKALSEVKRLQAATRGYSTAIENAAIQQNRMQQSMGRSTGSMRRMRSVAQQAGYQIADLAIVLQNGQNAFQAVAIQGGQLAGAFGAIGAAVGAFLTVGGLALSIFSQMRDEGATIPPVMASILDAFDHLSAYIKAVTIPNIREFIEDVKWAWQNSQEFKNAVIALAGALTVYLTPAIVRLTTALIALAYSNPFTALMTLGVAAAVYIIANWDKVKVFFEYGFPAAMDLAKAAYLEFVEQILRGTAIVLEKMFEFINKGINPLIKGLNKIREFGGSKLAPIEEIEAGTQTMQRLNSKILEYDENQRIAYRAGREGWDLYKQKLEEVNETREKNIEQTKRENAALEETEKKAKGAADKTKELKEELSIAGKVAEYSLTTGLSSFVDAIASAETNWKDFVTNFLRDIAKMILQQTILNAISAGMGGPATGATAGAIVKMLPFEKGGVFSGGGVQAFANGGVVSSPSLFPMSGGKTGLMGEAGPEAIMPLSRSSNGRLGVAGPSITINNNAGADVSVVRSDEEMIEIAVSRAVKQTQSDFSRSMQTGQGPFSRSMEQGYKARRRAT